MEVSPSKNADNAGTKPAPVAEVAAASVGAGAALTAVVACSCCVSPVIAPLIVGVLGVSGAVTLAGIKPYTPWLLAGSLLMLGYAFWRTHRPAGECRVRPRRGVRAMLWISALVWMMAVASAALNAADLPFSTLDTAAEPLRAAFNADVGKTRIVMLVSPT